MRISDWSSDVCSSDLRGTGISFGSPEAGLSPRADAFSSEDGCVSSVASLLPERSGPGGKVVVGPELVSASADVSTWPCSGASRKRSEEHTSELQSLMRNSYAVFCLKKKNTTTKHNNKL